MTKNNVKEIIHGKVDIQIGKHGLSEGLLKQIEEQFRKRKYLKVRFLELIGFDDMKEAARALTQSTNSKCIDIRGKTCVIKRLNIIKR